MLLLINAKSLAQQNTYSAVMTMKVTQALHMTVLLIHMVLKQFRHLCLEISPRKQTVHGLPLQEKRIINLLTLNI